MKAGRLLGKIQCILVLVVLVGAFFPAHGLMQSGGSDSYRYFEETEHTVRDEFLVYFDTHGGLEIFGYPITEAHIDQGLLVQYFQKARMEYHPGNSEPYRVLLGLLGDELRHRQPGIPAPQIVSRRRVYFEQTGHTVAYAFLDFFREKGGVDIFGYPISEMYFEEGRIVQYFQRLKLEWHPEDRTSPVEVGNLGEIYVNAYRDRISPTALARVEARPDSNGQFVPKNEVTGLRAVISLRYSVMGRDQNTQIVSVLVTDDNGVAVPNARVEIQFLKPNGDPLLSTPSSLSTNERGFARTEIEVSGGETGTQVIVQADVVYGPWSTTTKNVFLLWR